MLEFFLAVACGLAGGFARALLSGRLVLPRCDTDEEGRTLFDPGFLGTIFVGAVAGVAAWLFNASPVDPGINFRPLGWALIAGAAGDVVIDYYVNQRYGVSEQQSAGETIEQMASATNNQSREVEQAHEERRQLQQELDESGKTIQELRSEIDRLKKSGTLDD